jgi:hypothetical protein
VLSVLSATLVAPAHAALVGDTINCNLNGSAGCNPVSATVGAGPEFALRFNSATDQISLDIDGYSVTLSALRNVAIGLGWNFSVTDLDFAPSEGNLVGIANFFSSVDSGVSGGDGVTVSDVSFTADSFAINLNLSTWAAGDVVSFDLAPERASQDDISAVPLPATLPLMLVAGGLLGLSRKLL